MPGGHPVDRRRPTASDRRPGAAGRCPGNAPLFIEPQVAVIPVAHRLAGRDRVSVHELVGERLLQHPNAVPEWAALHSTPLVVARQARSVEEKLEWVAAGDGFSVVPQSVAMYYQRADITWMVLTDVAPNEVRLAVANRAARTADRGLLGGRP
jgi:DNA-binding transcriptional LysR family regulator